MTLLAIIFKCFWTETSDGQRPLPHAYPMQGPGNYQSVLGRLSPRKRAQWKQLKILGHTTCKIVWRWL